MDERDLDNEATGGEAGDGGGEAQGRAEHTTRTSHHEGD